MTPLQTLISEKVGGLAEYVASRRSVGRSWRAIARDLRDETGVEVTDETLRGWYGARDTERAAS